MPSGISHNTPSLAADHSPAVHYDGTSSWDALLHPIDFIKEVKNPTRLTGHSMVWPAQVLVMPDVSHSLILICEYKSTSFYSTPALPSCLHTHTHTATNTGSRRLFLFFCQPARNFMRTKKVSSASPIEELIFQLLVYLDSMHWAS